jgi:hypothetical protein
MRKSKDLHDPDNLLLKAVPTGAKAASSHELAAGI